MVSITLAVPKDLKKKMESFPEMNWSEVAREAIRNKVELMEKFRAFSKDSTLTENDAIKLGKRMNREVARRHGI